MTLLDIILIGIMLVSGLLAMIRGFIREILSIAAWVIAAVVTLVTYSPLTRWAREQFASWPEYVVLAAVAGFVFLATLLIVSVITVRFSDMVLDSRVGALDRTLGFLFGLARGLIIVVVAFMFFVWLVPERQQPAWIAQAKSRAVLEWTGDQIRELAVKISPELERLLTRRKTPPDKSEPEPPPDRKT